MRKLVGTTGLMLWGATVFCVTLAITMWALPAKAALAQCGKTVICSKTTADSCKMETQNPTLFKFGYAAKGNIDSKVYYVLDYVLTLQKGDNGLVSCNYYSSLNRDHKLYFTGTALYSYEPDFREMGWAKISDIEYTCRGVYPCYMNYSVR